MNGEPKTLKAGRQRAQRRRTTEAIKRVRSYTRWVKTGSDFRTMPAIPSSADYRIARRAGWAPSHERLEER